MQLPAITRHCLQASSSPSAPFANERCRTEAPKLQFYPGTTHLHACHPAEEGRRPDLPGTAAAVTHGTAARTPEPRSAIETALARLGERPNVNLLLDRAPVTR